MMKSRRLRGWVVRLLGIFRREEAEAEFAEELESHLQLHIEDNLRAGMSESEARRQALVKLGGMTQAKEAYRRQRGLPIIEMLAQDVRYGLRVMKKRPGFTVLAVITLALGVGANTAIFSVVNGVLLKSLPYPEPERLVAVSAASKETPEMALSFPDYLELRAQSSIFENVAARMPTGGILTGDGEPERIIGRLVTASFFPTLGIRPQAGRFFTEAEDRPEAEPVMVLSYGLWQQHFGGDPTVIGRSVRYNGESWTVIGVAPAEFDFYGQNNLNNQFFTPLGRLNSQDFMRDRNSHVVFVTGRLKPGASLEQARAEMRAVSDRLAAQFPDSNNGTSLNVRSFLDDYVRDARPALLILSLAVMLVLLIACANVANLLLARAASRRKEIALRMALGAGRLRIVRQLLTESLLLAVAGGALGFLLAVWGIDVLVKLNPNGLPRLENISLDLRTLLFTLLVTLVTGFVFSLMPALKTSKVDFNGALKEGGLQAADGGLFGRRLRGALVIAEVAVSLVLLVGAGLLVKSFWRLMQVDPGFDARNVLTLRLRLPDAKYREAAQTTAFLKEVAPCRGVAGCGEGEHRERLSAGADG